jgi:tripartite-type tricarboxylate transporter receptor subunit TctC
VDRLNREIVSIAAEPDFRDRLAALGGEAVEVGPGEFKAQIGRELRIWTTTIREANIRLD